jgi:KDO2-lipid IV(A) lauroyltransferase
VTPLSLLYGVSTLLGWLVWLIPNGFKKVVADNIRACFSAQTKKQQDQLIRRTIIESIMCFLEIGFIYFRSKEAILKKIVKVSGFDDAIKTHESGQAVIIASPHVGSWEILGVFLGQHLPITILYKQPKNEKFDQLIKTARTRAGSNVVPIGPSGLRILMSTLKKKGVIGMLPDQVPGEDAGVFADFYGVKAYTMFLMGKMALKSNAEIFYVFAERLPWGKGYHIHCIKGDEAIKSKDQVVSATASNQGVEQCIDIIPDQYQWGYKRFKRRPEGAESIY